MRKVVFSKKNGSSEISARKCGRAESYWNEATRLFRLGRFLIKPDPRQKVVRINNIDGETRVSATFYPLLKLARIGRVSLEKNRICSSYRNAKQIIFKIEVEARKLGARRIVTNFTILPPRTARDLGFEVVAQKDNNGAAVYKYEKKLTK